VKFVTNKPALIYNKTLIIGDLHIDRGSQLLGKIFIKKIAKDINSIYQKNNCNKLFILGDVKDEILSVPSCIYTFFDELDISSVSIVKGNHDGGIDKLCNELGYKLYPPSGCVFGKAGLMHGHSWPSKELMDQNYLVMSHLHPMLSIKNKFNISHTTPVWMTAKINKEKHTNTKLKLVVMPAFNSLLGKKIDRGSLGLSPILKNNIFKLNSLYIYGLNGILIGKLIDFLEG